MRRAVALRRADDPAPDDPFRGLYLTARRDRPGAGARPRRRWPPTRSTTRAGVSSRRRPMPPRRPGPTIRLRRLASAFGLDAARRRAAARRARAGRRRPLRAAVRLPERRRHPAPGRASAWRWSSVRRARPHVRGRARLGAGGPLVAGGLLVVEDPERPFLTRALRVPGPGGRAPARRRRTGPVARRAARRRRRADHRGRATRWLARALVAGVRAGLPARAARRRRRPARSPRRAGRAGRGALVLDLRRLGRAASSPSRLAGVAVREARLTRRGLVGGPVEALAAQPRRASGR